MDNLSSYLFVPESIYFVCNRGLKCGMYYYYWIDDVYVKIKVLVYNCPVYFLVMTLGHCETFWTIVRIVCIYYIVSDKWCRIEMCVWNKNWSKANCNGETSNWWGHIDWWVLLYMHHAVSTIFAYLLKVLSHHYVIIISNINFLSISNDKEKDIFPLVMLGDKINLLL